MLLCGKKRLAPAADMSATDCCTGMGVRSCMDDASCQKEGSLLSMASPSSVSCCSRMDLLRARDETSSERWWGVSANEDEVDPPMFSSPFPSSLSSSPGTTGSSSSSMGSSPSPSGDGLGPSAPAPEGTVAVLGAAVQTRARYSARSHSASSTGVSLAAAGFESEEGSPADPMVMFSSSLLPLLFSLDSRTDAASEGAIAMAINTDSTTLAGDWTDVSRSPSRANTHQGSIWRALFQ
mmetsp:Transcript_16804/g.46130  ORF Transcript_16804/g.46130 Transcript_16804/m.46130 type:complete len:237 (+) Transcript_16804:1796-2506(+)